jgi:hypothetical protein
MKQATRFVKSLSVTAVALAALAACGKTTPDSGVAPQSTTGFAHLFDQYHADYEPAKSPAELSNWSDLVVTGTIVAVKDGRVESDGYRSIVMVVEADKTLKGPASSKVYVELPNPGTRQASVYDAAAPKSADVLLYLMDTAPLDKESPTLVDPSEGRPAGIPLYQPVNPQGVVIGDPSRVTQLLEFRSFEGSSLEQFLPDEVKFPPPPTT